MPGTLLEYGQAVHDVISVCRDGEQGFRGAAHAVKTSTVKEMFEQYSAQRAQFATELQGAVKALGFETDDPQGLGGVLFASWISLKGMLTGHDVHAILVEAERGEDWTIKTYRTALSKTLPPEIASIVQKQFEEVQQAHDRIRSLRDSTAPPPESKDEVTPAPSVPSHTNAPAVVGPPLDAPHVDTPHED
jgi:uncharacterized protein (TIGR02284 family)